MGRPSSTTLGPAQALALDAIAWTVGIIAATWARYDFALDSLDPSQMLKIALLAVAVQAIVGCTWLLYQGRHESGSFEEVQAVSVAVAVTVGAVVMADLSLPARAVPASVPLVGGILALVGMLGGRYLYRYRRELGLRAGRGGVPALVFGAGLVGHDVVRAMLRNQHSMYLPVGVLDDDPKKRRLRVHGIPTLGGRHDIPAALARTGAKTVVFCVADASSELIREVQRISLDAGATFKVVPSVSRLLDSREALTDVREMEVCNLIRRRQVDANLAPIAGYLTGKRVLVTGAGGSIGSELCRQVQRFGPGELMLLDRDESALHAAQLSLEGRALLDSTDLILADLRDRDRMREVFESRQPQVVFHAAALKHLTLLERHPAEAVKTNVWGTQILLELADGVERFVNISTDKAANPSSVLGYSKRITERLTAHAATVNVGTFLSVRFGNVLGSRGSVLSAFTVQAAAGGPITVTHPDVTRYFMTVGEAVQLLIQAAAIGRGGEALVLDMGEPVRIADLARHFARQAPHPVEVVYTGLRQGEKLHEELFASGESDHRPLHPLISHLEVPALHPSHAALLNPYAGPDRVTADLAAICRAAPELMGAAPRLQPNAAGARVSSEPDRRATPNVMQ